MDTKQANETRASQALARIQTILGGHGTLALYRSKLQISFENAAVVLRGELPNAELREELTLAVRRAGVLWRVNNEVNIAA